MNLGAENLGNKLADIALKYEVGIEIDFEDDSALKDSTILTQVVEMAETFRVRAGPEVVFTINVGAASGAPGYHIFLFSMSLSSALFASIFENIFLHWQVLSQYFIQQGEKIKGFFLDQRYGR